jgi:hypothetical protein
MDSKNVKECCACKQKLPFADFRSHSGKKDNLSSRCRTCAQKYESERYAKLSAEQKKKINADKKARAKLLYEQVAIKYLETHPCIDCGEDDPIVLEFDHVRGEKKFNIADVTRNAVGRRTLEKEIEKCEVRCANCHRRKTKRERENR